MEETKMKPNQKFSETASKLMLVMLLIGALTAFMGIPSDSPLFLVGFVIMILSPFPAIIELEFWKRHKKKRG